MVLKHGGLSNNPLNAVSRNCLIADTPLTDSGQPRYFY